MKTVFSVSCNHFCRQSTGVQLASHSAGDFLRIARWINDYEAGWRNGLDMPRESCEPVLITILFLGMGLPLVSSRNCLHPPTDRPGQ